LYSSSCDFLPFGLDLRAVASDILAMTVAKIQPNHISPDGIKSSVTSNKIVNMFEIKEKRQQAVEVQKQK
jgi:hypothetical protein